MPTLPSIPDDASLAAWLAEKGLKPVPGSEPQLTEVHRGRNYRALETVLGPQVHEVVTPKDSEKPPYWPYKSRTEQRYAALLDHLKRESQIAAWWYEPCKGLYLAPDTSYTPDFLVQWLQGPRATELEMHEVKGRHIREKDWIKVKQAAARYTCFRWILAQWKEQTWHYKDIPRH